MSETERKQSASTGQRYRVIDMDSHVMEPESMWLEYVPAPYREVAPRAVYDAGGRRHFCAGGVTMGSDPFPRPDAPPQDVAGGFDPKARVEALDAEGIEAMVVYPTAATKLNALEDVELVSVFCRAYNDWMRDFRSAAPERLLPMAVMPQRNVVETLSEARRRAVTELGLPGIFMRPNPCGGHTLDDPAWEPLWSLLEELDVPLGLHEGTSGAFIPAFGKDRTDNFMFRHMMSHAFEHMAAMLALIGGGVLERHPNLRVCFVEAGCGWVPYWLERMEHHVDEWGHTSFPLPKRPTEYFVRQCFVSTDSEEEIGLKAVIDTIGPDGICWSTDYPHTDHVWEGIAAGFTARTDLSDEVKAKVMGANAARAYKL